MEASLKAFISLLTANWTSFNVTTTSQEPKRLKKRRKFENQKKKLWVFLYPRTVFFREAQAETADKRSWFDWAVPSLAFFSSLASLALSLSRSLAPSMATFPSSLGGAPACASLSESLFSKKMLFANQLIDFQTGNCGSVTKSWHQQPLLLPNRLYRFHGSLPFIQWMQRLCSRIVEHWKPFPVLTGIRNLLAKNVRMRHMNNLQ